MKIMSIDLGDARTGLAICDKDEMMASPIGVLHERDFDKLLMKIKQAAEEHRPDEIIVGHPRNMDGTFGDRAAKCAATAQSIAEMTDIPVHLWDERQTTVSAIGHLNMTNTRGKKRKAIIDAVAATIILEDYLTYRKNIKKG